VKYIPNVAMCARCSQGLVRMAVTYATPETGEFIVQSYAHSQLDVDHEPLPVPADGTFLARCDWCSSLCEEPIATIHCEPFTIDGGRFRDVDGKWATCSDCVAAYHEGGIPALTERSVVIFKHGDTGFVRRMHAAVSEHFLKLEE
jgi:ferredoxin